MRLLLKTALTPGSNGLSVALAFLQAGADVYLDPTVVRPPLPAAVAELFMKPAQPPFDLTLHHLGPAELGVDEKTSTVTVAHTSWSRTTMDTLPGRSSLRKRLKPYDLVVGYDGVATDAIKPYVSGSVATVQGGLWSQLWPGRGRDWNAPALNFCMVGAYGSESERFVAINAFRELREEHPELNIALHIKTSVSGLDPRLMDVVPGLKIYYEGWPEDVLRDFYYSQHVFIAPDPGESQNLPALEFLSSGGTVIAVNWGGHTQWLSSQIGYALNYQLEPISAEAPNCLRALASTDHLKEIMLHAYRNRAELARKASIAADLIPAMCDWPKVIDRLMERVGEVSEHGERVLHKYRVAQARMQESRQVVTL